MNRQRVGFFGGTFDPIHNGHLAIATAALESGFVDSVMLVPSATPPWKVGTLPSAERLRLARLAVQGRAGMEASDIEFRLESPSYTVRTMEYLTGSDDREYSLILGSDAFMKLDKWYRADDLMRLCSFLVCMRSGADESAVLAKADELRVNRGVKVSFFHAPSLEISSTDVRERILNGGSIAGLVPECIESELKHLITTSVPVADCDSKLAEIDSWLRDNAQKRYAHSVSVMETADMLAGIYGVDRNKARLAGLAHDCAKLLPLDELKSLASEWGRLPAPELCNNAVLHSIAGAVLARRLFGIEDMEILNAIASHTVGNDNMSPLEVIIYTADYVEPLRTMPESPRLLELAKTDLYKAALEVMNSTIRYNLGKGVPLAPETVVARNNILEHIKENNRE